MRTRPPANNATTPTRIPPPTFDTRRPEHLLPGYARYTSRRSTTGRSQPPALIRSATRCRGFLVSATVTGWAARTRADGTCSAGAGDERDAFPVSSCRGPRLRRRRHQTATVPQTTFRPRFNDTHHLTSPVHRPDRPSIAKSQRQLHPGAGGLYTIPSRTLAASLRSVMVPHLSLPAGSRRPLRDGCTSPRRDIPHSTRSSALNGARSTPPLRIPSTSPRTHFELENTAPVAALNAATRQQQFERPDTVNVVADVTIAQTHSELHAGPARDQPSP